MSQITEDLSQSDSQRTSNRWSSSQTLSLLGLLLEARREGRLNSIKKTSLRLAFKYLLVQLQTLHPERHWELKTVENKYQDVKNFWRVFREADGTSGTTYDADTGRLKMSKQNETMIIERHHPYGRRVVANGLLIGEGVTYETWEEIFSNDPTAGHYILEVIDDEGFAAQSRGSRSLEEDVTTHSPFDEEEEEGDLPTYPSFPDEEDEEGVEEIVPMTQPSRRSASRRSASVRSASVRSPSVRSPSVRSPSSQGSGTPARSIARGRKREERVEKEEEKGPLDRLAAALADRNSKPREHIIITKPAVSPEAIEIAFKDAYALADEYGIDFSFEVVDWIGKDPINALMWNSLPSKEAKDAFLAKKFSRNL